MKPKLHPKQVENWEATHFVMRKGVYADKRLAGFNHIEYARECAQSLRDVKVFIKEIDKRDPAALFPPGYIKPA